MDLLLQLKSDETVNREMGWGIFVDRYGPIICGFARNAGLPSSEADDIMQTVLFNFFRVADQFEYDPSKGRFRGYLETHYAERNSPTVPQKARRQSRHTWNECCRRSSR